jgi:hypothetical protein
MAILRNLPSTLKFTFSAPEFPHFLLFVVIVTCSKAISRHWHVHLRNTTKDLSRAGIWALNRHGYLQSTAVQHWQNDGELVRIKMNNDGT